MLESKAIIRSEPNGGFAVAEFASTFNDSFDLLLSVDQADLRELLAIEMHRRIPVAIAARNSGEARRQMHEHLAHVECR